LIPTDKPSILEALEDANRRVFGWFDEIPTDDFFTRHAEVWSASDNLDHLIKSAKPFITALKMPRPALQTRFGKSAKPSRDYQEICRIYREELAKGAQASGRFLPEQQSPAEKSGEWKEQLLANWVKASGGLVSAAGGWTEADLDLYQLPHPILGKLTVREMLFFTIYHNLRHASQEGD
jgi:uncharacterized damage-inducible protein DinB